MRDLKGIVGAAVAATLLTSSATSMVLGADADTTALDETCVPAAIPFDADDIQLTGVWAGDASSIYYIRQIGDAVWWNGMHDDPDTVGDLGREFDNVAQGTLDGTRLTMDFADVPRGKIWGNGALSLQVGADDAGNLQITRTTGDFGDSLFTPCQPPAVNEAGFAQPFSYALPFGQGFAGFSGGIDQEVVLAADVPESGLTFWLLGPGLATHCSASPELAVPTEPSPDGIIEFLRANPALEVGEETPTTVAGLPAVSVDVTTAAGEFGCEGDGIVRLWKESGLEGTLPINDTSRLLLVDLDGRTFAVEMWSRDHESWWPIAQSIVDTLSIDRAAGLSETVGEPADDGARVVRVDEIDERTRDLVIESPSVGYARARLLLPEGHEDGADQDWPTLYLLHGAWDDYTSWTRETEVADIPELKDILVVMPDAGQLGWYSDWENAGAGGQPAWETFHTVELPQLIERNWGGGDDRVVAGLSMGGFGALSYAARHPGMYGAAAAYSGVLDTVGSDFQAEALMWGDKTDDLATWEAHNPLSQVAALEGTDLYISYGDGAPGPLDNSTTTFDSLEGWIRWQNDALVAKLAELGIPATVDAYGKGTHTWPYWERALRASLPVLLDGLSE